MSINLPHEQIAMIQAAIESLEGIKDIHSRVRDAEQKLLFLAKKGDENSESEQGNRELSKLLDEINQAIEDVEIKINQLDMRLSSIGRLGNEHIE